ncbi:TetR/AcrR family transcriptional regulator [Clostridium sp.]|jgi:AcrR family transcriptional regulator|uniref:TetR/AcrR family transcriptional regulator n=1 Tax=Clostridium sp. TaxID=1506 RepID=UPI0025867D62|nr:TetR/AcrR family transcriptional regulator [Clostridium sp.]MDF2503702.1 transcriptional regulator, AcrR family [Clostridium sp.]
MINKTDLRVLKTHESIKNTFSNLLLGKSFKDITVQNICDEALIGRSTFYDHYYDKYDLLNKMAEEIFNEFKPYIKSRFNLNNSDDFTRIGSDMIKHFSKKKTIIQALLNVHTESVNLYDDLKNVLIEECSSYLENKKFISKFNVSNKYICGHYSSYVLTSFQLWLELGENDDDLELANEIQTVLFESDSK